MATTQPPRHRIRIRKATLADGDALAKINSDAFASSVMFRLMYPNGSTADSQAKFVASLFPAEKTDGPASKPEPRESIIMVAELLPEDPHDDSQGEVVAFSKWAVTREPLPESVWNAAEPLTAAAIGEGVNLGVFKTFIGGIHAMRRSWVKGDPSLVLRILACAPAHGRLGAGTALLRWGAEFADREGLNTWLEATPAGYSVYRRGGFEDMDVQDLPISDLYKIVNTGSEDWGLNNAVGLVGPAPEGVYRCVMMKRVPTKAQKALDG